MCRQLKWALLTSLPTVYLLAECLKSLDFKSSCIETNQTTSSSVLVNQSMWKWIRMLISPHISTLPVYLWELGYWIVFFARVWWDDVQKSLLLFVHRSMSLHTTISRFQHPLCWHVICSYLRIYTYSSAKLFQLSL